MFYKTHCEKVLSLTCVLLVLFMIGGVYEASAQASSLTLNIPKLDEGNQTQFSKVKVTLSLTSTDSVQFEIDPPWGSSFTLPENGYMGPGSPMERDISDDVTVVKPPENTGVTAEELQYDITLNLSSDYDNSCRSTPMDGDETWSISLNPKSAPDPQVASACPVSFRQRDSVAVCDSVPPVRPDGPKAEIQSQGDVACQGSRPPVSTVLVLDKSGSMSSDASTGPGESRMEALRGSVEQFVTTWDTIRSVEDSVSGVYPQVDLRRDDKLGVVFFEGDEKRMDELGVADWSGRTDVLYDFSDLGKQDSDDLTPNLNDVGPGGVTSLGDGLIEAVDALGTGASPDRRKVVLAMTDGLQNTSEYVKTDMSNSTVETHPKNDPTSTTTLLEPGDDIQVYTVTTGPPSGVNADLNEDLARTTGGDYENAEINASEMRLFFNQMLQNFVKFTSFETLHQTEASFEEAGDTYRSTMPVTITSTSLVATLSAPRSAGYFGLRLTGPNGETYEKEGTGTVTLAVPLLAKDPANVAGEWDAEVELIDPASGEASAYVSVIADDFGVSSDFSADAGDTEPGLTFPVEARLTGLGGPIENADARVIVERPDTAKGDILSRADLPRTRHDPTISSGGRLGGDVDPSPTVQGDTFTPAEAKLYQLMKQNPDLLSRSSNTVQLADNGRGPDQTAGDGTYAGRVQVREPGHYTLRYVVEGTTEQEGTFRREQIRTVHARAVPNRGPTEVGTQVDDGVLQLGIVPRTFTGSRLGPGYKNYLWLTTPDGTQLRPEDQLNGGYTAEIPFSGDRPEVDLHFLRLNTSLADDISGPPVELGENTRLASGIENGMERNEPVPPDADDGDGGMSIFGLPALVVIGLLLLIALLVALRRRRST
ncbi:MAG: vWA domain-containing protein [Salinivenus sp.]|uniref:vWA domain-containing protein n=1 Tax=Salinibacter sp. TaxID=2065818 RepID=UPI002FC275A8